MTQTASGVRSAHRFMKSGLSLMVARYGQPLLTFAIFFLAARFLSLSELGEYVLLINLMFILQAASVLGLGSLLTREVSRDLDGSSNWFGAMMSLALPTSLLAWLALSLGIFAFYTSHTMTLGAVILGAALPFSVVIQSSESVFLANGRSWALFVPSLVECSFRLALSSYLLIAGHGLLALLWAYTASRFIGMLAAAFFLKADVGRLRLLGNRAHTRVLVSGLPTFGLMFVAAIVFLRVDVIIIASQSGEEAAGLYGAAFRLVSLTFLLPESLVAAMFPVLSRKLFEARDEAASLVRSTLRILLACETPLVLIVAATSWFILPLLFGKHFAASGHLAAILSFVLLPHTVNGLLGFLLQADQKERTALVVVLAGLAFHIPLMWFFVSWKGIDGGAWGLLLSTSVMAATHFLVIGRSMFALDLSKVLPGVLSAGLAGGALMAAVPGDWVLRRLVLAPALATAVLFGLRTISPRWLGQTLKALRTARG